jgi:hypothetical protein
MAASKRSPASIGAHTHLQARKLAELVELYDEKEQAKKDLAKRIAELVADEKEEQKQLTEDMKQLRIEISKQSRAVLQLSLFEVDGSVSTEAAQ